MVSIIIPIYNVKKYLNQCISSAVNQVYSNIEIILVDDGSNDGSELICDEWKEKDERIQVVHKHNGGLSDARNCGLEIAKGDFLLFLDGDDAIHSQMLQIMLSICNEYSADIVCCDYEKVYDDKIKERPIETSKYAIRIYDREQALANLDDIMVVACCKLYRKYIFKDVRYSVGRLHEDEFLIHKLLYASNCTVKIELPLYYYLQREDSIVHSISMKNISDAMDAFQERVDFVNKNKLYGAKEEIFKGIARYTAVIYNSPDIGINKEMRRYVKKRFRYMIRENKDVNIKLNKTTIKEKAITKLYQCKERILSIIKRK